MEKLEQVSAAQCTDRRSYRKLYSVNEVRMSPPFLFLFSHFWREEDREPVTKGGKDA